MIINLMLHILKSVSNAVSFWKWAIR